MRTRSLISLFVAAFVAAACSSGPDGTGGDDSGGGGGDGGGLGSDSGGGGNDSGGTPDGGSNKDSGTVKADSGTPPAPDSGPGPNSIQQHCVDQINSYRQKLNLPPYARMSASEACADGEAKSDAMSNKPHGAFPSCGEWAQNECPGWPSANMQSSLDGCLSQMWAEGPGQDFSLHGHYINMSSQQYTKVFCGFYDIGNGKFWSVQDFK
jgi:hypothetical protein